MGELFHILTPEQELWLHRICRASAEGGNAIFIPEATKDALLLQGLIERSGHSYDATVAGFAEALRRI